MRTQLPEPRPHVLLHHVPAVEVGQPRKGVHGDEDGARVGVDGVRAIARAEVVEDSRFIEVRKGRHVLFLVGFSELVRGSGEGKRLRSRLREEKEKEEEGREQASERRRRRKTHFPYGNLSRLSARSHSLAGRLGSDTGAGIDVGSNASERARARASERERQAPSKVAKKQKNEKEQSQSIIGDRD